MVGFLGDINTDTESCVPETDIDGMTISVLSHLGKTIFPEIDFLDVIESTVTADAGIAYAVVKKIIENNASTAILFFTEKPPRLLWMLLGFIHITSKEEKRDS